MQADGVKLEHRMILTLVQPGSSVLDLGCGDGELLSLLSRERKARVRGIEIDEQAIYKCVAKGLSVVHGDIDTGLSDYGDRFFDYVIFDQSLEEVRNPDRVINEALRVGRNVIVAFPNFAHYSARLRIFFFGRTPITRSLPYEWHDTPNLHFLSILDFINYCWIRNIIIKNSVFIGSERIVKTLPNLRAEVGIFLITKPEGKIEQGRHLNFRDRRFGHTE